VYTCIYIYIYTYIYIYERTLATNDDFRGASIRGFPQCLYISVYITIYMCMHLFVSLDLYTATKDMDALISRLPKMHTHIYTYTYSPKLHIYIHILQIIRLFDVFYFIHKYMYINIHILQTIISFHVFFGLHFCLFRFEYPTSRFNGILVRQDHVWNMSITTCRCATIFFFHLCD